MAAGKRKEEKAIKPIKIKCLKCDKPFKSRCKTHNRVCGQCKRNPLFDGYYEDVGFVK